jgi:hypothetical protein
MVSDEKIPFMAPIALLAHDSVTVTDVEGKVHTLVLQSLRPITAVGAQRVGTVWGFVDTDGNVHGARDASADPERPPKPPKRFTLKAGRLLFISDGAYSSYSITGLFVVLKDFDPFIEAERYLADKPAERERYTFQTDAYLAQLLAAGYLAEVDHHELHLSDYHSVDDMWVSGPRVDK